MPSNVGGAILNFAQVFVQLQQQQQRIALERERLAVNQRQWQQEMRMREQAFEYRKKIAVEEQTYKDEQLKLREQAIAQQETGFQQQEQRRGLAALNTAINTAYDNDMARMRQLLSARGKEGVSLADALREYAQMGEITKTAEERTANDTIDEEISAIAKRLRVYQQQHVKLFAEMAQEMGEGLQVDPGLIEALTDSAQTSNPGSLGMGEETVEGEGTGEAMPEGASTSDVSRRNQRVETMRDLLAEKSQQLVGVGQQITALRERMADVEVGSPDHMQISQQLFQLQGQASELDMAVKQLNSAITKEEGEAQILRQGEAFTLGALD